MLRLAAAATRTWSSCKALTCRITTSAELFSTPLTSGPVLADSNLLYYSQKSTYNGVVFKWPNNDSIIADFSLI